ncbi:MAG: hypothetical protein HGA67_00510 [Candidatus Yonathbacteria bacterium]|nr:hypothetical protein [Candidatus Yonathbacteria bacterium]
MFKKFLGALSFKTTFFRLALFCIFLDMLLLVGVTLDIAFFERYVSQAEAQKVANRASFLIIAPLVFAFGCMSAQQYSFKYREYCPEYWFDRLKNIEKRHPEFSPIIYVLRRGDMHFIKGWVNSYDKGYISKEEEAKKKIATEQK